VRVGCERHPTEKDFRSGEFIEKRAKYVGEIVEPLKAEAYEIGQAARNCHV
jgi:hypothetical protein